VLDDQATEEMRSEAGPKGNASSRETIGLSELENLLSDSKWRAFAIALLLATTHLPIVNDVTN
jgi:hypothetical protein